MANINFIEKQIQLSVEAMRPPVEMRPQLDIGYHYEKNTLEIIETRPRWDKEDEVINTPIAKTRYIKTQKVWKIYWMRASGKWESYPPAPEVKTINEFFKILKEDAHACFWG